MTVPHYNVRARVSTDQPEAIRPVLRRMFPSGTITLTGDPREILLRGGIDGESAAELNRTLLSEMRHIERKTRLHAEWSVEGRTEKFLDYEAKATKVAATGDRRE